MSRKTRKFPFKEGKTLAFISGVVTRNVIGFITAALCAAAHED